MDLRSCSKLAMAPLRERAPSKFRRGLSTIAATCLSASALATISLASTNDNEISSFDPEIIEFLDLNCYECHNEVDRKGSLDLTSLPFNPGDAAAMTLWALAHDRVRDGEMPPPEDSLVEDDERASFLNRFENALHTESAKVQSKFGRARSRRLNRIEFENTIHDLLGVDIPIKENLPEDPAQDGFSNIAEAQQISHYLLQKYLEGIDLSLDEAFSRARHQRPLFSRTLFPEEVTWNPTTRENGRGPHLHEGHALSFLTSGNYQGRMQATTVNESGWYRITVRAKAHNPPPGRGVWTQIRSGVAAASAPTLFWVGSFQAMPEPQNFTFETWMQAGHKLEMRPGDHTLKTVSVKYVESGEAFADTPACAMEWVKIERIYKGMDQEHLRHRLFGDLPFKEGQVSPENPQNDLECLMIRFANMAYRRQVSDTEISRYIDFAQSKLQQGASFEDALRSGYRALLASPRFLYFTERTGQLDDFSIASRLSYFLWSSMPDRELLDLADNGTLSNPDTLRQQVDRMLDHPGSEAFIRNFTDSWLDLIEIDFTTPDNKLYPEFDPILKHSMLGETRSFIRELIVENLSVANVIDSDFTMLNERLAQHYGIEGVYGNGYQKTPLKPSHRRGGIITHGSVLKVSANGTTTSPVIRGVWLLERVLGEHISPPPDDVPAVEPDIRGATSIRDQLDKHRSTENCMACHQKIDPPGFALESYDVIGGWRQHYRALPEKGGWTEGPEVDPSYELPNGKAFSDIDGFKAMVLAHPEKIVRNMVEKLLTYSTGASIEFADRREIDQIVEDAQGDNYGFRSLIHAATQSEIFQSK